MFDDPSVSVLAMIFLCFIGMVIMFICIVRAQAAQLAYLKETQQQQLAMLADVEKHIMDLSFSLRTYQASEASSPTPKDSSGIPPVTSDAELSSLLADLSQARQRTSPLSVTQQDLPTPSQQPKKYSLPDISLSPAKNQSEKHPHPLSLKE